MIKKGIKTIIENRRARHDYFILEKMEAGIVLVGTEVKSLRANKANLKDSYAIIKGGELFILGLHISPYEQGNRFNVDPDRTRKLLMHKKEINYILGKIKEQGLAFIPLRLYFKDGRVKIELGICKGKKLYDKRQNIAEREQEKSIRQHLHDKNKYEVY